MKLMPVLAEIVLVARGAKFSEACTAILASVYLVMAIDVRGKTTAWQPHGRSHLPGDPSHYSPLGLGGQEGREHQYRWHRRLETVEDVLDSIRVEESAVQVRAASFAGPRVSEAIIDSLGALVRTINYNNINGLWEKLGADFG